MTFRLFSLTVAAIFLATLAFPRDPLLADSDVSTLPGLMLIAASYGAFSFAYAFYPRRRTIAASPAMALKSEVSFVFLVPWVALSALGLVIICIQLEQTVGLDLYVRALLIGGPAAESARSSGLKIDSQQGGLPGFLKLLHIMPLISMAVVCSLGIQKIKVKGRLRYPLVGATVALFFARSLLFSDRMPHLLFVPLLLQYWARHRRRGMLTFIVVTTCLLTLLEVVSAIRGLRVGLLQYVILYAQSGVINDTLLMQYPPPISFGLVSIFAGVRWVLKAFGVNLFPGSLVHAWVWSDAQNGFGYLFIDFSYAAPAVFLVLGAFAKHVDARASASLRDPRPVHNGVYLWWQAILCLAVLSTISVPAFAAPEYSLLCSSVLVADLLKRRVLHTYELVAPCEEVEPPRADGLLPFPQGAPHPAGFP